LIFCLILLFNILNLDDASACNFCEGWLRWLLLDINPIILPVSMLYYMRYCIFATHTFEFERKSRLSDCTSVDMPRACVINCLLLLKKSLLLSRLSAHSGLELHFYP